MGFAENMLKDLDKRQEAARQASAKTGVTEPGNAQEESSRAPRPSSESYAAKDGLYEKEATDVRPSTRQTGASSCSSTTST